MIEMVTVRSIIARILLPVSVFVLTVSSCGIRNSAKTSYDKGYYTDDLKIIPLYNGKGFVFVDIETGEELSNLGVWENASLFYGGYSVVSDSLDNRFFIDKKGHILNRDAPYIRATPFFDGLAWVMGKDSCAKTIDSNGKTVFEMRDVYIVSAFHNGFSVVINDIKGSIRIVDKKGNILELEPECKAVTPIVINNKIIVSTTEHNYNVFEYSKGRFLKRTFLDDGLSSFSLKDNIGEYSYMSQNLFQAICEDKIPLSNIDDEWGIFSLDDGKPLIDYEYDGIVLDGDNYLVKKGNKYGWIDAEGNYLINPRFGNANIFGEDLWAAAQDDYTEKWGFIDKKGNWAVKPEFEEVLPFRRREVAPARDVERRQWGLIDKSGDWIAFPQFLMILDFGYPDRFVVLDESRAWGVINTEGKYVVRPRYPAMMKFLFENLSGTLNGNIFAFLAKD